KTDDGLLFQVEPHFRIPRTHERFYGIMLELLERKRVRVPETNEVIIQQLDGPLTHIAGIKAGLSYNAEKVMDINDYLSTMADDVTPIFVMGAMVRGKVNKAGTDNYISSKPWFLVAVSNYPLSAAYSTALVFIALANKWELH
ncbi:Ribosomal biogenesis, partial [Theobroma cacao]